MESKLDKHNVKKSLKQKKQLHNSKDKKQVLVKKIEKRINSEPYIAITIAIIITIVVFVLYKIFFKSKTKTINSIEVPSPKLPPANTCVTVPSLPKDITADVLTADSILIRWTGSKTATSYTITLTGTGGVTVYNSIFTTLSVSGLAFGGTWSIVVIAVNKCGQSSEVIGPTIKLCSAPPLLPVLTGLCNPYCILKLIPNPAEPPETVYYISSLVTPTSSISENLINYISTCPYSQCIFDIPTTSTLVVTAINNCGVTSNKILF